MGWAMENGERIPVSQETVGGESHPGAGGGREDDDGQRWGAGSVEFEIDMEAGSQYAGEGGTWMRWVLAWMRLVRAGKYTRRKEVGGVGGEGRKEEERGRRSGDGNAWPVVALASGLSVGPPFATRSIVVR